MEKVKTTGELTLYHGNDHILPKPLYGFGSSDNDYGSGFYTTAVKEKASDWALTYGGDAAIVNAYSLDLTNLNVLNLEEFGVLSWIAEIISNRGTRGEAAAILGNKIVEMYKVSPNLDFEPDIIVGYRADDSYSDIIDAFLQNKLNTEEVQRLFMEGELGYQYFIKSQRAFDALEYKGYEDVKNEQIKTPDYYARSKVSSFLRQRDSAMLLNGYIPNGITAVKAAKEFFEYDSEYRYYSPSKYNNIKEYLMKGREIE